MNQLIEELKQHEGYRKYPYKCPAGKLTIGYGFNLDAGMDESAASLLLEFEVGRLQKRLSKLLPFWSDITKSRQDVLVNMAYNLGVVGLLDFKRMLNAIQKDNIGVACAEMQDSKWFSQVGGRGSYLVEKFRKG